MSFPEAVGSFPGVVEVFPEAVVAFPEVVVAFSEVAVINYLFLGHHAMKMDIKSTLLFSVVTNSREF